MAKAKTVQVRWNGAKEDPDTIVQHGITFNKGEWTDVPVSEKDDTANGAVENRKRLSKFRHNSWFEVKGYENDTPPTAGELAGNESTAQTAGVARAGLITYKPEAVTDGKGKAVSWRITGKNPVTGANVPGPTDEYADEASAQVVCDGLNQVAP